MPDPTIKLTSQRKLRGLDPLLLETVKPMCFFPSETGESVLQTQ